jgi:hypothetical protein
MFGKTPGYGGHAQNLSDLTYQSANFIKALDSLHLCGLYWRHRFRQRYHLRSDNHLYHYFKAGHPAEFVKFRS